VFDVASRKSFESLDAWVQEAHKFGASASSMVTFVVGNKIDKKRVVPEEEGRRWADARGFRYFEMSTKDGTNVQEALDALFRAVYDAVK
jgi:DnaJ family protein C protein 27